MMQQYSGDFLAAVDGLRSAARLRRARLARQRRAGERLRGISATARARAAKSRSTRRRTPATASTRLWLEPEVRILPAAAAAIERFEAAVIGPGSFYTSLMPIFLVKGAARGDPRGSRGRSCS